MVAFLNARTNFGGGAGKILAITNSGATLERYYDGPITSVALVCLDAATGRAVAEEALFGTPDGGTPVPLGVLAQPICFDGARLKWSADGPIVPQAGDGDGIWLSAYITLVVPWGRAGRKLLTSIDLPPRQQGDCYGR